MSETVPTLFQLAINALPVEVPERCLRFCVENEIKLSPRYFVHGFNRGNRRDFNCLEDCVSYLKQRLNEKGVNAELDKSYVCVDCHHEVDDYCGLEIMAKPNKPWGPILESPYRFEGFSSVKELFEKVIDHLEEYLDKWENNFHIHVGNRDHTWGPVWVNIVKIDYTKLHTMIQTYVPKAEDEKEFDMPECVAREIAHQRKLWFLEGAISSDAALNLYYDLSRVSDTGFQFRDLECSLAHVVEIWVGEYGSAKAVASIRTRKENKSLGTAHNKEMIIKLTRSIMSTFGAARYTLYVCPWLGHTNHWGDRSAEFRVL